MYSGSTLRGMRYFDAWFGVHQKIDRTARKHLNLLLDARSFPNQKQILRFEGMDGPDGIKRKSPAQDEPWHFYDPRNPDDNVLPLIIKGHYDELVTALKQGNNTRASFEAAWLSHAVVDGLTPAHHYPYEEELIRLRGSGNATRNSPKEKLLMPGATLPKRLSNNWQMWGDKGLLATHIAFEIGIAVMIIPLRLKRALPTEADIHMVELKNVQDLFIDRAKEISELHIYEHFYESGWTPRMSRIVRQDLVPTIVNTVTLVWYMAAREAWA